MYVDARISNRLDLSRTCFSLFGDQFDFSYSHHVGMRFSRLVFPITYTNNRNVMLKCVFKVLIIKLRSANSAETKQYRKAAKALLVLIPLLGITYLVVMAGPNEGVGKYIFANIRALLISTQASKSIEAPFSPLKLIDLLPTCIFRDFLFQCSIVS